MPLQARIAKIMAPGCTPTNERATRLKAQCGVVLRISALVAMDKAEFELAWHLTAALVQVLCFVAWTPSEKDLYSTMIEPC